MVAVFQTGDRDHFSEGGSCQYLPSLERCMSSSTFCNCPGVTSAQVPSFALTLDLIAF
jgi:hypothetical protein